MRVVMLGVARKEPSEHEDLVCQDLEMFSNVIGEASFSKCYRFQRLKGERQEKPFFDGIKR